MYGVPGEQMRTQGMCVSDVLRCALPPETRVLAGQAALGRPITWAIALHLRGGFPDLEPDALAIVSLEMLRLMPSQPTVAQTIRALARQGVSALALRGTVEPYQLAATQWMADQSGCVLLQLPGGKLGAPAAIEDAVNQYLRTHRGRQAGAITAAPAEPLGSSPGFAGSNGHVPGVAHPDLVQLPGRAGRVDNA